MTEPNVTARNYLLGEVAKLEVELRRTTAHAVASRRAGLHLTATRAMRNVALVKHTLQRRMASLAALYEGAH